MNSRALVVDDDPAWQGILRELLEDAGLVVDACASLDHAQMLIGAQPHRVAVVDLSLSGDPRSQDGLHVLAALRERDPGCTSILLSGYATVAAAVSAITTHGAMTCVQKERFSRSQFREWVQRALAAPPALDSSPALIESQSQPGSCNALIVEDDAGWRGILDELLTDAGCRVKVCAGFGDALGWLRREKFHLAVIDLSLNDAPVSPGSAALQLPGYRLLTTTRLQGIPSIVVSGIAAPAEIEQTYNQQGIFAFMEKQTFDRRAFLRTVHAALESTRSTSAQLEGLTAREQDVLAYLAQGLTNKAIADALVISPNTVKRHVKAIYRKLDIHTRSAAAARAVSADD